MKPHPIATALNNARKDADLTLRQLADKAGVSVSTVWQLGSGRHMPRVDSLDLIADALGYDIRLVKRTTKGGDR